MNLIENLKDNDLNERKKIMSMIEDRADKHFRRDIRLFFGCRNKACNLLDDETKLFSEFLTRLNAFSREVGIPKTYNYDLLRNEREWIYNALANKEGMVYVCGKVAVAESTYQSLVKMAFDGQRGLGCALEIGDHEKQYTDAEEVLKLMKNQIKDVNIHI